MFNVLLLTLHMITASLTGKVIDQRTGLPIANAYVQLFPTNQTALTDSLGAYAFSAVEAGTYTLKIKIEGYTPYQTSFKITGDTQLSSSLQADNVTLEEVVVQSITADKRSGTSYTNISGKELKAGNLGYDLPMLLNLTPSVVTTTDAGAGVGYTGIRIRGTDPTRINVTLNGIPINDAESHGTFWVNMPDLASSVENIQIQRGVGTSSNGAAAFGASINVQTSNLSKEAYGQISSSAGSFNTLKNTFQAGSGLVNNKFAFEARLSKITSDGFMDRASSDLKSFFVSGGYFGKQSLLKVNVFSGKEKTYQAWNGVSEATLQAGNRTYNQFEYANQTDNYQQDHYQVIYSNSILPSLNINAALFYTKGRGYYEEFKTNQAFASYALQDVVLGDDTVRDTDLIRQKWLHNDFYGFTFSANFDKGKVRASLGGGLNQYLGQHFGKVIWAQYASNSSIDGKYYDNEATKNDGNVYGKLSYQFLSKASIFIDLQTRFIGYSFLGVNQFGSPLNQKVQYVFFNPKAGVTYDLSANHALYASASVGQKEPTRGDFVVASPEIRPRPERLFNIESGVRGRLATLEYVVNFYHMDYKDQLVITGNLDDVGNYLRANVANSYRRGIELQVGYRISTKFSSSLNLTLSDNKIKEYNQIVYDSIYSPVVVKYNNSYIAMSPAVIFGGQLAYTPVKGLVFTLLPKHVGKQYLDNTSNKTRKLKAYSILDARISYEVPLKLLKNLTFTCQVNNILNKKYESNGYTYTYFDNTNREINSNFYYPQAGINFMAGATFRF